MVTPPSLTPVSFYRPLWQSCAARTIQDNLPPYGKILHSIVSAKSLLLHKIIHTHVLRVKTWTSLKIVILWITGHNPCEWSIWLDILALWGRWGHRDWRGESWISSVMKRLSWVPGGLGSLSHLSVWGFGKFIQSFCGLNVLLTPVFILTFISGFCGPWGLWDSCNSMNLCVASHMAALNRSYFSSAQRCCLDE